MYYTTWTSDKVVTQSCYNCVINNSDSLDYLRGSLKFFVNICHTDGHKCWHLIYFVTGAVWHPTPSNLAFSFIPPFWPWRAHSALTWHCSCFSKCVEFSYLSWWFQIYSYFNPSTNVASHMKLSPVLLV